MIELIDNQTVACSYQDNWVFFVNDKPYSGWYHDCRFIFVNTQNGDYSISTINIYPYDQSTDYELISEANANQPAELGDGSGTTNEGLQPNDHYYAVIIADGDYQQYWNDVSLIFNTLIDIYGYKKENIYVHFGPNGTSQFGDDLDDPNDPSYDIDYSAFSTEIHSTFNELAGITNNNPDISGLEDHPNDYDPDLNSDGYIQMEEAFQYADDQDTWSEYGYTNPYTPGQTEEPVQENLLPFNEDLLSLCGLAGHVENSQTIENRSYLVGGDLDIDPEVTLTFSDGTSLYLGNENAQVNVSSGALLNIGNNMDIYGNSPNKITVDGNIQIGTRVTFQKNGSSGLFYGLILNNCQMATNMNLVTFNEAQLHNYGAELNITNSDFINCLFISSHYGDVYVSTTNFYNTCLYLEYQTSGLFNAATVDNCFFFGDGTYYFAVIDLWNYRNYFIENNTISGYYNGIQLWQSGAGLQGNQNIFNNEVSNSPLAGITIFNSMASVLSNYLHDNYFGIRLYDNSNVALYGNPGAQDYNEVNYITNNDSYEVYASTGSFPWYFRNNAIIDEDNLGNPTDPMVYYEPPTGGFPLMDVKYNCWGNNFDPAEDLYPSGYMVNPTWCPGGGGEKSSEVALQTFLDGEEYFKNEEYADAKTTFESVVELYSKTQYASAAMKKLFALEHFTDNDYSTLKQYYETNDSIQADTVLTKLATFLSNKC